MRMLLQFGYGMMEHTRVLLGAWGGGDVILSPRDLDAPTMERFAADLRGAAAGNLYLDPQFYLPDTDHERLTGHPYWPENYQSGDFWAPRNVEVLLRKLAEVNQTVGTEALILPGLFATKVDDLWEQRQRLLIDVAASCDLANRSLATIAVSSDVIRDDDQLAELLEEAAEWPVDGFYVVAEHDEYLVDDATWMKNFLDLCVGLRLKSRRVFVGYCHHQMLCLAAGAINGVCSGTWMNVRMFPPAKFRPKLEDEFKQRRPWYYAPRALSEYKVPSLDVARTQGVLSRLRAGSEFGSTYADSLFTGAQPSSVGLPEQAAFRHYLQCLKVQVGDAVCETFDKTYDALMMQLATAESLLDELRDLGVFGDSREMSSDAINANRSALAVLRAQRGAILRRDWSSLLT